MCARVRVGLFDLVGGMGGTGVVKLGIVVGLGKHVTGFLDLALYVVVLVKSRLLVVVAMVVVVVMF